MIKFRLFSLIITMMLELAFKQSVLAISMTSNPVLLSQPQDLALPKTHVFSYQSPNQIKIKNFNLAIAVSEAARSKGLMNQKINPQQGMLFVFDQNQESRPCFWMKNTIQDLGLIFLDAQGRVLQKEKMKASTTNLHCARKPIAYAIELSTPDVEGIELNGFFKTKF